MLKMLLLPSALLLALALAPSSALAANHDVSWGFGISHPPLVVQVGDTITFNYASNHDVRAFPDATAFGSCDFSGATLLQGSPGPYVHNVVSPGTFYFGCGVGSHCVAGSMSIEVTAIAPPAVPGADPRHLALVLLILGLCSAWFLLAQRAEARA